MAGRVRRSFLLILTILLISPTWSWIRTRLLRSGFPLISSKPKLANLTFLHIPKTGSSFITVLRNYLDACEVKDFTCPGIAGGGSPGDAMSNSGFPFKISREEMERTKDCHGALNACGDEQHASWIPPLDRENVVVMMRRPLDRLVSFWAMLPPPKEALVAAGIDAESQSELSLANKIKAFDALVGKCAADEVFAEGNRNCIRFAATAGATTSAIKMLSGWGYDQPRAPNKADYALARYRLLFQAVFFGIAELWRESVCTFHCEVGGKIRESELLNTRDNGQIGMKGPIELSETTKRHLDKVLEDEMKLYDEAKTLFLERAKNCGCL